MGQYDLTLGPGFLGIIFNTYLYGIVTYQFVSYWRVDFNDALVVRCMVLFLFLLDTVHSVAVIYMTWEYLITGYADPDFIVVSLWPFIFTPIGTACAALVTHIFLGWRIFRMSENKLLYSAIIVMAIPTFALGVTCGIKVSPNLPRVDDSNFATAWLLMQVVVDTFVTVTLAVILLRCQTGRGRTEGVLRRIARGAIQTGLFADIFSLGNLITLLVLPTTTFYAMFGIPIGRIYSNALLDTLLVRESLRLQLSGNEYERTSRLMGLVPSQFRSQGRMPPSIHLGVPGRAHTIDAESFDTKN